MSEIFDGEVELVFEVDELLLLLLEVLLAEGFLLVKDLLELENAVLDDADTLAKLLVEVVEAALELVETGFGFFDSFGLGVRKKRYPFPLDGEIHLAELRGNFGGSFPGR